jgi:hypothetical protein
MIVDFRDEVTARLHRPLNHQLRKLRLEAMSAGCAAAAVAVEVEAKAVAEAVRREVVNREVAAAVNLQDLCCLLP